MKTMTHASSKEVRKAAIQYLRPPLSPVALLFLGKRLRDRDDDIRRHTFMKFTKNGITIDMFPSPEQRLLIMKEGLTD